MTASRIAQGLVVSAGLAIGGTAAAQPPFEPINPTSYMLSFHQVVAGVPTPPQEIRLRNITAEGAHGDALCCQDGFTVTGDLQVGALPGQDVSWQLTCLTDNPAGAQTFFDFDYCGVDCNEVSGTLTISAVCSPPVMSLSALQLEFPAMPVSVSQQQTITITNLTSGAVTWPVAVTGAGFTLVGDAAITLAAGASGDVTVALRPGGAGGQTGALEIGAAGDDDHVAVPLAGDATAPMVTSDSTLAFGDVAVGEHADAMLAIHNLDTEHSFRLATLTSDDPAITATLPDDPTLAAGATVMVPVHFAPVAAGAHAAQLSVGLDGADAPIATVEVSGQGVQLGSAGGSGGGGGGCNAAGGPGLGLALLAFVRRRRTI